MQIAHALYGIIVVITKRGHFWNFAYYVEGPSIEKVTFANSLNYYRLVYPPEGLLLRIFNELRSGTTTVTEPLMTILS